MTQPGELRAYYWESSVSWHQLPIGSDASEGAEEAGSDSDDLAGDGAFSSDDQTDDWCTDDMRCGITDGTDPVIDGGVCTMGGWSGSSPPGSCPPGTEANFQSCFPTTILSLRNPIVALRAVACIYIEMWNNASDLGLPGNVGEFPMP
jgi:hypothetical protein